MKSDSNLTAKQPPIQQLASAHRTGWTMSPVHRGYEDVDQLNRTIWRM
ncbi:hypothetical protein [Paenibacillus polymyxa]|nr:hypothetical protein [Paenibacillus polymyxa]